VERSVCRKANSFAVLVLIRVHGASGIFVGRTKRNINSAGGFGLLAEWTRGRVRLRLVGQ
jgi:hypothetical protein